MTLSTCRTLAYPVHVGPGLLATLHALVPEVGRAHRIGLVTDSVVGPLYADRVRETLGSDRITTVTIPAGEAHKTRDTWARITDTFLEARLGRDSLLIALGGGVIGDLTGFVAATYLRGVPVLQLPTTVLAMVDAAIGGKTGVDTAHGKNLVGAFHPPVAVVADLDVIATLPHDERSNGLAEALKHGVIADATYFADVAGMAAAAPNWQRIIDGSVAIKTAVVAADEREHGLRKTLNFGHTIGHAIELLLDYRLAHGQCVAIGMMVETRIALALGLCDAVLLPTLEAALTRCGLRTAVPRELAAEAILTATGGDKKARAGTVEYALPRRCGAMAGADRGYGIPVPRELALTALRDG